MSKYLLIVYDGPTAKKNDIIQLISYLREYSALFGLGKESRSFGIHIDPEDADCFVVRPETYVSRGLFYSSQLEEAFDRYNTFIGPNDAYKTKVVICHKSQKPNVVGLLENDYEECTLPTYDPKPGEPRWHRLDIKSSLADIVQDARIDGRGREVDTLLGQLARGEDPRIDEANRKFNRLVALIASGQDPRIEEIKTKFDELLRQTV